MLMGEIPSRDIFSQKDMRVELEPYLKLVEKVKKGDLDQFYKEVESNKDTFEKDGNLILIKRLRYNVIKFGLRKVNLCYSKISLSDIKEKLGIDVSELDLELIVAKAIRDGVVDASIDHEKQELKT